MRKLVFALLAGMAFSSVATAQTSGAWADKLFAGETTHDFGTIARGVQAKYSFNFKNLYKVPLEITDVRVSCGCVKAEATSRLLQSGETAQLNIFMDSNKFVGPKTVRVYVTVGPKYISTAVLTVSALALGDVVFSPSELEFGALQIGAAVSKQFDVEYTGTLPQWQVTEIIKSASAPFELKVEELPRLANNLPRRGYRLTATIKADAAPGSFNQEVSLKTNDPSGPVLTYHITGNVQSNLAVSPAAIVANGLRVGEAQTKKVFVRASRPFRILAVDGQGDGVTVDVPNRQESTQVLTVNIQANRAGDIRRQLMVRTDLDNESTILRVDATIEP